jgi:hypothetical protein
MCKGQVILYEWTEAVNPASLKIKNKINKIVNKLLEQHKKGKINIVSVYPSSIDDKDCMIYNYEVCK